MDDQTIGLKNNLMRLSIFLSFLVAFSFSLQAQSDVRGSWESNFIEVHEFPEVRALQNQQVRKLSIWVQSKKIKTEDELLKITAQGKVTYRKKHLTYNATYNEQGQLTEETHYHSREEEDPARPEDQPQVYEKNVYQYNEQGLLARKKIQLHLQPE